MARIVPLRAKLSHLLTKRQGIFTNVSTGKRCLVTLATGGPGYVKQDFNFISKGWPIYRNWDRTHWYLNENSKVISIEGSFGVGKSRVANALAQAFDMEVVRDVVEDDLWTFEGFREPIDMREHNDILPPEAQYYTTEMFWNDPDPMKKGRPMDLQYKWYLQRYYHYCRGLCTLFNTGRGFFSERSPHSDHIMAMTMEDCGLMSKEAHKWFTFARRNTAPILWKPHVIIYLRAPVSYVRKGIEERNKPGEVDARNLTDKFLERYQYNLENVFLKKMKPFSEIIEVDLEEFDINDDTDLAYIADRLTKLDLDGEDLDDLDKKFVQWKDGTHNRDSMDFNRCWFSHADMCFGQVFDRLRKPRIQESRCSYEEHFLRVDLLNRDPRSHFVFGEDPDKDSYFQRHLIGPKRNWNYDYDFPKNYFFC